MIKMFSNLRRICPKISFDVLNPTSSKASRSLKKTKKQLYLIKLIIFNCGFSTKVTFLLQCKNDQN